MPLELSTSDSSSSDDSRSNTHAGQAAAATEPHPTALARRSSGGGSRVSFGATSEAAESVAGRRAASEAMPSSARRATGSAAAGQGHRRRSAAASSDPGMLEEGGMSSRMLHATGAAELAVAYAAKASLRPGPGQLGRPPRPDHTAVSLSRQLQVSEGIVLSGSSEECMQAPSAPAATPKRSSISEHAASRPANAASSVQGSEMRSQASSTRGRMALQLQLLRPGSMLSGSSSDSEAELQAQELRPEAVVMQPLARVLSHVSSGSLQYTEDWLQRHTPRAAGSVYQRGFGSDSMSEAYSGGYRYSDQPAQVGEATTCSDASLSRTVLCVRRR